MRTSLNTSTRFPHRELMKMVAKRVSDGSILRLIKSWLRAPIVEEDKDGTQRVVPNRCGTPQGGVISPLLANVYLNPLDHGVNDNAWARPVWCATPMTLSSPVGPAEPWRCGRGLTRWLKAKGLKLNESKTRLVDIRQTGINFLGFNLTWRQYASSTAGICMWNPVRKAAQALRENLGGILNHWTLWQTDPRSGQRKPTRCCEAGRGTSTTATAPRS